MLELDAGQLDRLQRVRDDEVIERVLLEVRREAPAWLERRGLLPAIRQLGELRATALELGIDVALANKETLVAGGDLVRALKERGIRSAVVGKVEAGIARKIIGPGGTGYLERPQPDETYKLRQQEA